MAALEAPSALGGELLVDVGAVLGVGPVVHGPALVAGGGPDPELLDIDPGAVVPSWRS